MARVLDRERAIQLRKLGYSYSQIKRELGIPKSTLSDWLSSYPLTSEQLAVLRENSQINREIAIEKYRETMRFKKEERLIETYEQEKKNLLGLTSKELLIAGLFLYWGEGGKTTGSVRLNNTDPNVVKFALFWLISILKVPRDKIKVYLHLYKDMNQHFEMKFWSKELQIPLKQFVKPYIKSSNREFLTHKGFGHGTCGLVVNDTRLKERIMMGIKAISDYYSLKI